MGFHELIDKVHQAETALEARERQASADWRQTKASWRALWTPGRIVIAGLASGFIVGQARPLKRVTTGQSILQMATALAGLFASGSAQAAAQGAEEAADAADAGAAANLQAQDAAVSAADAASDTAAALDAERVYRAAGLP